MKYFRRQSILVVIILLYCNVMKLYEIIGWIGVGLILLAYALSTFSVLEAGHIGFGLLNLFGAIGIIISSYRKRDFQPIFLNVIWLLVAVIGLLIALT